MQRVRVDLPAHLATLADNAGGQLSIQQKDQVQNLLLKHSEAFATADGKVGSTDLVKHTIDTGNASPIKTPYRPPAFAKRAISDANLDQMLKNGVIEPSNSPWSSPVVLANKKDGLIVRTKF